MDVFEGKATLTDGRVFDFRFEGEALVSNFVRQGDGFTVEGLREANVKPKPATTWRFSVGRIESVKVERTDLAAP